jgi:hypothetical protein
VTNEEWLVGKNPFDQLIIFPESEPKKQMMMMKQPMTTL